VKIICKCVFTFYRQHPEKIFQKYINIKQNPIKENSYQKIEKFEDDLDVRENMTVDLVH
jgi:hypothetical protein